MVEGPPEEVRTAKEQLVEIVKDLRSKMAFAEIEVDQKYHRHIIGRNGANGMQCCWAVRNSRWSEGGAEVAVLLGCC